jgi:hypothetical protein
MPRTLDTLFVALLAAECGAIQCAVRRLQHAVSRVKVLLRDELGMTETAKELSELRKAAEPVAFAPVPAPGEDPITGKRRRKPPIPEAADAR